MDTIPSTEFRKTYAKLDRPTVVTVNGHPIGVWTPRAGEDESGVAFQRSLHALSIAGTEPLSEHAQAVTNRREFDAMLDRQAERERFNSRPFTPVPKKR